jgi:hypothetical protein
VAVLNALKKFHWHYLFAFDPVLGILVMDQGRLVASFGQIETRGKSTLSAYEVIFSVTNFYNSGPRSKRVQRCIYFFN